MRNNQHKILLFLLPAVFSLGFVGCNGDSGQILGEGGPTGPSAIIPPGASGGGGTGTATKPALGEDCHSSDSSRYCIALKYVVFKGSDGSPAVTQAEALENLKQINAIWDKCGIAFQIDEYREVNASDYGANAAPSSMSDLSTIRSAFVDEATFLIATTYGAWSISANAWTTMPGGSPLGIVVEGSVGTYYPIIAHELGHYLNLDHVSDSSYLMTPVIYTTSTNLSASECSQAESAINYFWAKMLR